jgi:L-fuculose-phosphate aldolase
VWEKERRTVIEAARAMISAGMVVGTQGNISLRFHDPAHGQLIAITPSSTYYDSMLPDDVVIMDLEGKIIDGIKRPSVETGLHLKVYAARENVNAVVHTHPVFASIVSVTAARIPAITDDQVIYLGGEIRVAEHAVPGSDQLVKNVVSALKQGNAVIMSNHGALTAGRDMRQAIFNNELLERISKIYVYSIASGKLKGLPDDAISKEMEAFRESAGETGLTPG